MMRPLRSLTPSPTLPAPSWWLARVNKANLAFAIAIVLLVVFASVGTDSFLTDRNLVSISRQIVTNGFLSLGMLLVILTGGIDLSVGAVLAFAGLLATGLQAHMPWPVAICVALLMGLAVGFVNGILIARFKLQPFIATLATMGSVRGLLYIYSETPQYPADPLFRSLLGGGFIGPMPVPTLLFLLALPIVWFYLNHTISGRARLCDRRQSGGGAPRRHQCAPAHHGRLYGLGFSRGTGRRSAGVSARHRAAQRRCRL